MSDWNLPIVQAFAQAIFPSIDEDAELARQAHKEGLAKLMETDGASMDFVTSAVSSEALAERNSVADVTSCTTCHSPSLLLAPFLSLPLQRFTSLISALPCD